MAHVDFIRPIEALHGKLKKTDKVSFSQNSKSKTKYTVSRDDWKMHYKTAATRMQAPATQTKFAAVAAAAAARAIDPTKLENDAIAFRNQSRYTTMRGFLFADEWNKYQG